MFITFEGIEGSGKTTQSIILKEYLEKQGYPVIHTRNPGGTDLGTKIRELVLHHQTFPITELLLFLADRNQHVNQVIRPALQQNKIVICDRYYHSTFAYQAGGRHIDSEAIHYINDLAIEGIRPDITFLIDIPVEMGLKRAKSRNQELDKIEKSGLDFHYSVRNTFLKMAENDSIMAKIEGNLSPDLIHQEIIKILMDRFPNKFS